MAMALECEDFSSWKHKAFTQLLDLGASKVTQVVECLLSKSEILSPIPSTTKKKKKKERKKNSWI
jgi:hypothetical protein